MCIHIAKIQYNNKTLATYTRVFNYIPIARIYKLYGMLRKLL